MKSIRSGPFFRSYISHAHVLYRKILASLQGSALSFVISTKNSRVEGFFFLLRNTLREITYYLLPVKVLIPYLGESSRTFNKQSMIPK